MHSPEGLERRLRPKKSRKPTRTAATIEQNGPTSSRSTFHRDTQRQKDNLPHAHVQLRLARSHATNESNSKSKSKSISLFRGTKVLTLRNRRCFPGGANDLSAWLLLMSALMKRYTRTAKHAHLIDPKLFESSVLVLIELVLC